MSKIKWGVVFNYIGMLLNSLLGIFMTPFMIGVLGELEYGLYQLVVSMSGYLTTINMGTGAAMTRFVSMYRAKEDKNSECNYILVNALTTFLLVVIVVILGMFIRGNICSWFPKVIASEQDGILAKMLCLGVVCNVSLAFLESSLEGLVQAYERIDCIKFFLMIKVAIRYLAIYALLKSGCNSLSIVLVDNVLVILQLLYMLFVLKVKCGFVFVFNKISLDKSLFKETVFFSAANLLSSLSGQLNNNIDKAVLGYYCTAFEITVYSVANTFYTIFTSLGVSLNNIFLNKVTSIIYTDKDNIRLEKLNIKIGRFENFFVGMVFCGFLCIGSDFVNVWMGEYYKDVFGYAVWLIIPSYILCISGVQTAILDAANKRLVQAVVMVLIGVVNVVITIILVPLIGGIGAAIGTFLVFMLGRNVFINFYLYKFLKINVIRIFREVLKGFWLGQCLSILTGTILLRVIRNYMDLSWGFLIISGIIFVIIYTLFIFIIGLNSSEKQSVMSAIKKYV